MKIKKTWVTWHEIGDKGGKNKQTTKQKKSTLLLLPCQGRACVMTENVGTDKVMAEEIQPQRIFLLLGTSGMKARTEEQI